MFRFGTSLLFTAFALLLALHGERSLAQAEPVQRTLELRAVGGDAGAPLLLRAGESAELELSGLWHNGCVPALQSLQGEGRSRVLRLRSSDNRICTQAFTPFVLRLPTQRFDEDAVGVVRVVVLLDEHHWLANLELRVQSARAEVAAVAAFNVAGAWYSPRHSGSGLNLIQAGEAPSERVSGLWFNFGPDGAASWFLLAETRWTHPQRVEGEVFRLYGEPYACTLQMPNPDCELGPAVSAGRQRVGGFVIEFDDVGHARLKFNQPGSDGQPVSGRTFELQKLH